MAEANKDAMLLISISWQALTRAISNDHQTQICDSIVVTLFAGLFIEANLNHIIKELNMKEELEVFLQNDKFPGMQDKLAWFYNKFIAKNKAMTKKELRNKGIYKKLKRRYPGFIKLYNFRNDLAHGIINNTAKSIREVERLRQKAKDIVYDLYKVVKKSGYSIPRNVTYIKAIQ